MGDAIKLYAYELYSSGTIEAVLTGQAIAHTTRWSLRARREGIASRRRGRDDVMDNNIVLYMLK